MKRTIGHLVKTRGLRTVSSISPHTAVFEALRKIKEDRVPFLIVESHGRIQGWFSVQDLSSRLVDRPLNLLERVEAVMCREFIHLEVNTSLDEALQVMQIAGLHHMPVMSDSTVLGFVDSLEVAQALLEERDEAIHDLKVYIHGFPFEDSRIRTQSKRQRDQTQNTKDIQKSESRLQEAVS